MKVKFPLACLAPTATSAWVKISSGVIFASVTRFGSELMSRNLLQLDSVRTTSINLKRILLLCLIYCLIKLIKIQWLTILRILWKQEIETNWPDQMYFLLHYS